MERLNRREFLDRSGKIVGGLTGVGILSSLPIINSGCKGNGPRDPVKVNITFFNHTQGELGQKSYDGLSGEYLEINVGSLGYDGVDRNRIAVRKATGNRETMGELLRFSKTGSVSPKFPENDENWEAYLMNTGNGANYNFIDDVVGQGNAGILQFPRGVAWNLGEGVGTLGPPEPIIEAYNQIQASLDFPWKKQGNFTQSESQGLSMMYVIDPLFWIPGKATTDTIQVDPVRCPTYEERLKWFVGLIFGRVTGTYPFLGGEVPAHLTICNQSTGDLNLKGIDLLNYVYVKDAAF